MIVLDTHAWVWWVSDPDRLPQAARETIRETLDAGVQIHVSSISTWEVAMLVERGRLELTVPVEVWIARAEAAPELTFVPLDNRIALRAVALEGFDHRDPADRIIASTALELGATLVTADARLRAYPAVATLWD